MFDFGLYEYYYPGAHYNDSGDTKFNTTEAYLAVTWKNIVAKYSHSLTDYFGVNEDTYGGYAPIVNHHGTTDPARALPGDRGDSKGSGYAEINGSFPLMDAVTLGLHIGHLDVANYSELDYTDYKASLSYDAGWAVLSAAWIDSDAQAKWYRYCETSGTDCEDPTQGTVVASVVRSL